MLFLELVSAVDTSASMGFTTFTFTLVKRGVLVLSGFTSQLKFSGFVMGKVKRSGNVSSLPFNPVEMNGAAVLDCWIDGGANVFHAVKLWASSKSINWAFNIAGIAIEYQ